jgi:hypothetical protein
MKPVEAILAAALLLGLAGCALRAKPPAPAAAPAAPAPPPEPLSIPQTQVQLPRQQPLDQASLATAPPVAAAPPAAPPAPAAKPPQKKNTRSAPPPPKPETPVPVEEVRPPVREIIPAPEQQQLRRSAQDHRKQALQLIAQAQRRGLTAPEQALVTRINQFVNSSGDAEKNGDLRSADDLAGRALILAKELQSGK